jgi:hypothetical protein
MQLSRAPGWLRAMEAMPPAAASPRSPGVEGIERGIRHAVYLTGGLVLLAFGILEISSTIGVIASCAPSSSNCFSSSLNAEYYSELGGAVFLVVVALVLFVLAWRTRGATPTA